jgi:hypothetical protein
MLSGDLAHPFRLTIHLHSPQQSACSAWTGQHTEIPFAPICMSSAVVGVTKKKRIINQLYFFIMKTHANKTNKMNFYIPFCP